MSLKTSLLWSYLSHYGIMVIQFGSSIILARLLLPEEIGIFSVAISFIALGQMLRDFGIGEYLIQEKELNSEKIRSGFTLSVIFAWVLAAIIYSLSQPLSVFYEEEGIAKVLPVVALNFIFIPFGAITMALLRKEMKLDLLLRINISSSIVGASISVIMALYGFSYMSLAWGAVAGTLTSVVGSQFFRPKELTLIPSLSYAKPILRYGAYNTVSNFAVNITTSAPDLILGKMLGMHLLGIFNRGVGLLTMVTNLLLGGIRPVLLPYFSQKNHLGQAELAAVYIRMTDVLLGLLWPVLGFIVVYAETIIVFLFGDNWIDATPIVQTLGVGGALTYIAVFGDELFKATGRVKLLASLSSVFAVIRVVAILISAFYGIQMVLYAIVLTALLQAIVKLHYIRQAIPFGVKDIIRIMAKNFLMAMLITGPCLLVGNYTPASNFLTLLYAGLLFLALFGACLLIFHRGFVSEILDRGLQP